MCYSCLMEGVGVRLRMESCERIWWIIRAAEQRGPGDGLRVWERKKEAGFYDK